MDKFSARKQSFHGFAFKLFQLMLKKTTETDFRQQQDENPNHLNDLAAKIAEHQQA